MAVGKAASAAKRKRVAATLVKGCAAAIDQLRPAGAGVIFLIYHRVGGTSGSEIDLPVALFEEQMRLLAEKTTPVTVHAALEFLAAPAPTSGPAPVVVTFDDGTADFADVALPILQVHGVPVTLYLATAFIDESRPFAADGRPLSWAALGDAMASGLVTVGSHTHTHALLDRLPEREAAADLDRSIHLIGDHLGVTPEHFAYPKAVIPSADVEREVMSRFRSAALAGTRSNPYGATNPYRIARSPIQVGDGMRWFNHKLAGGMAFEDFLRQALNRRRYSDATQ